LRLRLFVEEEGFKFGNTSIFGGKQGIVRKQESFELIPLEPERQHAAG
jgi:hypothetical protein